jgi:CspA family cold shock protein
MRGRCSHYTDRGFGFIVEDTTGQEFFVHATALRRAGYSSLAVGQLVEFEIGENPRTGRSCATEVELLPPITSPRTEVIEDADSAFRSASFMRGGR